VARSTSCRSRTTRRASEAGPRRDKIQGVLVFPVPDGKLISNAPVWELSNQLSEGRVTTHGFRCNMAMTELTLHLDQEGGQRTDE
jgi:hypothetical protein